MTGGSIFYGGPYITLNRLWIFFIIVVAAVVYDAMRLGGKNYHKFVSYIIIEELGEHALKYGIQT